MSHNTINTRGGHNYEAPSVEILEVVSEQVIFAASGEFAIDDYYEDEGI